MAAARHNLTRRALLGAGAAAPLALAGDSRLPAVLSQGPAASAASRRRWDRALAAYGRAEARLATFRRQIALLPPERHAFPACEPLDERFDDLESLRLAALRRLLRAPAPDLPALSLKIDLTVDDQAWELTGAQPCLAALKADARRLCRAD